MKSPRGGIEWKLIRVIENVSNPSFLAFERNQEMLYSVHGDRSEILGLAIDPESGKLELRGSAAKTGSTVCIIFRAATSDQE